MSGFSLHPQETEALLEQRVGDPNTRDLPPAPGFFQGALDATGHGALAALAGTRATIDTAAQFLPDSFFEDDDKPILPITDAERQYGGIRASNRPNPAAMGSMLQDLRPDPQTTGLLGQVTYGLTSTLPPAIAGGAVGGPLGAAAAVGAVSGVADYQTSLADGIDENTAMGKAFLTGGTNAVGAVMPASLGSTILSRIGSGVALNTGLGIAQRGATAELLRANGYDEMADQYQAFSGTEMLIDAVTGAAFGALPERGSQRNRQSGDQPPPSDGGTVPPSEEGPNFTFTPGDDGGAMADAAAKMEAARAQERANQTSQNVVSDAEIDNQIKNYSNEAVGVVDQPELEKVLENITTVQFGSSFTGADGVLHYQTVDDAQWAVDNGRQDIAQHILERLKRAVARNEGQKPSLPESSPRYAEAQAALKEELDKWKEQLEKVQNILGDKSEIDTKFANQNKVLPSDIDLSLSANAMNQFELDAAPGVPTTPAARNGHVAAMDTAYSQLMRNEPVDVKGVATGEFLPKPENPLNEALNQALEEGGYADLLRDAEGLRVEAEQRAVPLGEDLVAPPIDLETGDLYRRAVDLSNMTTVARPFYDDAVSIRNLLDQSQAVRTNFKLFNRNSSPAVQKITGWPSRPVPLLEWVKEVGGIKSGLSVDEAADMRARGVPMTEFYQGEVRDLFDGRKGMMNKYVKHDGLSIEDELPSLAAEQGYLGLAFASADYREAHQAEAQQKFMSLLQKNISGKAVYDYQVEEALDNALSQNQAKQALDLTESADYTLNDLSRYGLDTKNPTVPQIAEALAKRDADVAARAERQPSTQVFSDEEYEGIPFMRAPEVQAAFPRPVDAEDVNPLGFYSQLARVADQKLPGRGTGADFSKALDAYAKSGDFKPEELEYSGVKEWLSTQEKVSKADVLDFLGKGGVKLEEVTLGSREDISLSVDDAIEYIGYQDNISREQVLENYGYTDPQDYVTRARDIARAIGEDTDGADLVTKYDKYTLPGGENYREVLLTLPDKYSEMVDAGLAKAKEMTLALKEDRYADYERLKNERDAFQDKQMEISRNRYKSSHWDQPNVLAHFRLADHTDADGNKVLLIEEIQSDWHQEGRKKGYQTEKRNTEGWKAEIQPSGRYSVFDENGNWLSNYSADSEENAIAMASENRSDPRVPDAPFKKTWAELSFKRILRMAAENGYAKVAWTTGEIQADRFDLSKQISKVEWRAEGNAQNGQLKAYGMDGRLVMNDVMAPAKVEDYIGKEVAKRLFEQPDGEVAESGQSSKVLEGVDLKVGGEGMKGFYDDILPKTVGKVIGKLDKASKVGEVSLAGKVTPDQQGNFIYGKLPDGDVIKVDGSPLAFRTMDEFNTYVSKNYSDLEGLKLHGFDVNDELRERVMLGLPQFYRASGGKLPDGLERVAEGIAARAPEGMTPDDYLVATEVNNTVARMLPGAEVRMAARLYSTGEAGAAGEVFGAYRRPLNVRESRGVVDWSMAAPDAVGVARHEVLHGLKATGLFKPEEWDALTAAARDEDWIGQSKLEKGYKPEQMLEEAIAERFRVWRREAPDVQVRGVSGLVYKAFSRLNRLLERVSEIARKYMGLAPTADDVFSRIERGEVGKRESGKNTPDSTPYPVTAAEQILADSESIRVPGEDGGYADGKLAMMDAEADAIRAEQFGPLYEVAVNCFQRG